jgi:hypothetical protein
MKEQFVITWEVCQIDIPALQNRWVTNAPVKILCPQNIASSYVFVQSSMCWSVGLLMICQISSVPIKIVYPWLMTNCYFLNEILDTFWWKIIYRLSNTLKSVILPGKYSISTVNCVWMWSKLLFPTICISPLVYSILKHNN